MRSKPEPIVSDLNGRRVLITGGLGFIGSNLARRCLSQGADVVVFDGLQPPLGGNLANIAGFSEGLRVVAGDIRDADALRAEVRDRDLVFHCAAHTSHPNSMKDPYLDLEVNCRGTLNLLEALRQENPQAKLVHVGSSTQIGRMAREPVDETHSEFPLDMYSANKAAAEKYVLVYANAYGLRATSIRLANTYGPRSGIHRADLGFVNYFIGLALQGKEMPVYGDGAQRRTLSYVDDAVDCLLRAAGSEAVNGKAFFCGSDEAFSIAEIARAIAEGVGGSVRFTEWPGERSSIEIGDAVVRGTALREALGWEPRVGLREGLERTREYFLPRLQAYLK